MKIKTVVVAGSSHHTFVAEVVPFDGNYGLEIVEPNGRTFESAGLYVHRSGPNGRFNVTCSKQIHTLKRAQEVFEMWCLVVTCVVKHEVDLNTIFGGVCRGREDMFATIMGTEYHVSIVGSTIEGKI